MQTHLNRNSVKTKKTLVACFNQRVLLQHLVKTGITHQFTKQNTGNTFKQNKFYRKLAMYHKCLVVIVGAIFEERTRTCTKNQNLFSSNQDTIYFMKNVVNKYC